MKVLTNLLFAVFVLAASGASAQNSVQEESRDVVIYDPLFWKAELNIKSEQTRKIEQINHEFYQDIREKSNSDDHDANRENLARGLQKRSQKIYETLLPKQRRKLEKIIDKTAPPVSAP